MLRTGVHRTEHQIEVQASPDTVYGIVAGASAWPVHFAPTVHVERQDLCGGQERLRIWATANGEVKSWTSRRELFPEQGRVTFRQEVSSPPVASMGGEWIAAAGERGGTRLTLLHDFTATDAAGLDWLKAATDRNSTTELANIKALAETAEGLVFDFADSTTVQGDAATVYAFLHEAGSWPDRLPHVSRMELREEAGNVQRMVMDTLTKDGSAHTTESVRVCFPEARRILYKQIVTPPLMTAHVGEWTVEETGSGVVATSRHTIRLNPAAIVPVLGPDATPDAAKAFVRRAVGGNSAATLALAKSFAEGPR